jgi:hypothetical protein
VTDLLVAGIKTVGVTGAAAIGFVIGGLLPGPIGMGIGIAAGAIASMVADSFGAVGKAVTGVLNGVTQSFEDLISTGKQLAETVMGIAYRTGQSPAAGAQLAGIGQAFGLPKGELAQDYGQWQNTPWIEQVRLGAMGDAAPLRSNGDIDYASTLRAQRAGYQRRGPFMGQMYLQQELGHAPSTGMLAMMNMPQDRFDASMRQAEAYQRNAEAMRKFQEALDPAIGSLNVASGALKMDALQALLPLITGAVRGLTGIINSARVPLQHWLVEQLPHYLSIGAIAVADFAEKAIDAYPKVIKWLEDFAHALEAAYNWVATHLTFLHLPVLPGGIGGAAAATGGAQGAAQGAGGGTVPGGAGGAPGAGGGPGGGSAPGIGGIPGLTPANAARWAWDEFRKQPLGWQMGEGAVAGAWGANKLMGSPLLRGAWGLGRRLLGRGGGVVPEAEEGAEGLSGLGRAGGWLGRHYASMRDANLGPVEPWLQEQAGRVGNWWEQGTNEFGLRSGVNYGERALQARNTYMGFEGAATPGAAEAGAAETGAQAGAAAGTTLLSMLGPALTGLEIGHMAGEGALNQKSGWGTYGLSAAGIAGGALAGLAFGGPVGALVGGGAAFLGELGTALYAPVAARHAGEAEFKARQDAAAKAGFVSPEMVARRMGFWNEQVDKSGQLVAAPDAGLSKLSGAQQRYFVEEAHRETVKAEAALRPQAPARAPWQQAAHDDLEAFKQVMSEAHLRALMTYGAATKESSNVQVHLDGEKISRALEGPMAQQMEHRMELGLA